MFKYMVGLTGTIPTEIGLYKDMMADGYLTIFGNQLSGTLPTELSGWKGNCHLFIKQAPSHWAGDSPPRDENGELIDNKFQCPYETTGSCRNGAPPW